MIKGESSFSGGRNSKEQLEKKLGEKLNQVIDQCFLDFEKNQDVSELLVSLINHKKDEFGAKDIWNDAWDKERVNKLLDVLDNPDQNLEVICPECFSLFQKLVCQGESGENHRPDELNQRVLQLLQERLLKADTREMSDFMLELSETFDSNLFPNDPFANSEFRKMVIGESSYFIDKWEETFENNKDNLNKVLKIIKGARFITLSAKRGKLVDEQKLKASYLLIDKIYNHDNYFIRTGIEELIDKPSMIRSLTQKKRQTLGEYMKKDYREMTDEKVEEEFRSLLRSDRMFCELCELREREEKLSQYADPKLKEKYAVSPWAEEAELAYYGRLNEHYGVIYNSRGRVDSFFELASSRQETDQGKIITDQISLVELLDQAGFKRENMMENEYNLLLSNYKALIELPLRERIEQDFSLQLSDLPVSEQVKFLNFLSSKTEVVYLRLVLDSLKKRGLSPDYEKMFSLEKKDLGEGINQEEQAEIYSIEEENYRKGVYHGEAEKELAEDVLVTLKDRLENSKQYINFSFKFRGKIVAFCQLKPNPEKEGEIFAGSFNVLQKVQGLDVGRHFFKAILRQMFEKYSTLVGEARDDKRLLTFYEKLGFEQVGEFTKKGKKYVNIVLRRESFLSHDRQIKGKN